MRLIGFRLVKRGLHRLNKINQLPARGIFKRSPSKNDRNGIRAPLSISRDFVRFLRKD
jgi:hypothetical protein